MKIKKKKSVVFFWGGGGGVGGGGVIALCKFVALKTCNQDISKTITASSYKLGQLIENN